MLFGDKSKFAIEIKVNNIFGDEYVGEGSFVVIINNKHYGDCDKYATTFLCIIDELKRFYKNTTNTSLCFESIKKETIANFYYLQNYADDFKSTYDYALLTKTKSLIEWSPESAFDDGSHIIHFDDNNTTRVIGFKSCSKNGNFIVEPESIEEVVIDRNIFIDILHKTCEYLQSFIS